MSVMDFDLSKENIQPLRGGRNAQQLERALQAQTSEEYQRELQSQREKYENAIRSYEGDDPLENWYQYISWVEQSYPKHGPEGNLQTILENCISKFENLDKYHNDRRLCKIFIKYFDMMANPLELYQMLYAKKMFVGCADMYKAWAFYHEAAGDFPNADAVFKLGKNELAQPYDDLVQAYDNMVFCAGKKLVSGDSAYQTSLDDRRQALICLKSFPSGRVANVRVPNARGTTSLLGSASTSAKSNVPLKIFSDTGEQAYGGEAAAPSSILMAAKGQSAPKENLKKPGTWTSAFPQKKLHPHKNPAFKVHADFEESPQPQGLRLAYNFPATEQEDFSDWKSVLCVPDPDDPSKKCMYPKIHVYEKMSQNIEFSIEEVRARRYLRKKDNRLNVPAQETQQAIQSILGDNDTMQQSMHEEGAVGQDFEQMTEQAYGPHTTMGNEVYAHDIQYQQQQSMVHHSFRVPNSFNQSVAIPPPDMHAYQSFNQTQHTLQPQESHISHHNSMQAHTSGLQMHTSLQGQQSSMPLNMQEHMRHSPMQQNSHMRSYNESILQSKLMQHNNSLQHPTSPMQHPGNNSMLHQNHSMQRLSNSMQHNVNNSMHHQGNSIHHNNSLHQNNSLHHNSTLTHQGNMMQHNSSMQNPQQQHHNSIMQNSMHQHQQYMQQHPMQYENMHNSFGPQPFQNVSHHNPQMSPVQPHTSFQRSFTHRNASILNDSDNYNSPETSMCDLWKSTSEDNCTLGPTVPKPHGGPQFPIFEESAVQIETKGNAMKTTPFKMISHDDLAETGSRGGLDNAAAAQPSDGAKRLPIFEEDSNSFDGGAYADFDLNSTNTINFNSNLNAMKISTPVANKYGQASNTDALKSTRKTLFEEPEKMLSVILEETKSGSSASENHTTLKTHSQMPMISEEDRYQFNLAQNMKANAALRSSLLGETMECESQPSSPVIEVPPQPIDYVPSDPWNRDLINLLLKKVHFPGRHRSSYSFTYNVPRLVVKKEPVTIGHGNYIVDKLLGKGTFGSVFKAVDCSTKQPVAIKYQKPANKWEYYICKVLQERLSNHYLKNCFMDVYIGYFSDSTSIFISEFCPFGSLLNLVNKTKLKTSKGMKESWCTYFCTEMLTIMDAMHKVKIIHADIKPDNFLVFVRDNKVQLQLIDFGCSIDMSLLPENAMFTRKVTTEDFICCEMRDGRPWSYHTDYFCVAATAHVLLFDKYIQLQKTDGRWSLTQRFARYHHVDLWNTFFSSLLNMQDGLPNIDTLKSVLSTVPPSNGDIREILHLVLDR